MQFNYCETDLLHGWFIVLNNAVQICVHCDEDINYLISIKSDKKSIRHRFTNYDHVMDHYFPVPIGGREKFPFLHSLLIEIIDMRVNQLIMKWKNKKSKNKKFQYVRDDLRTINFSKLAPKFIKRGEMPITDLVLLAMMNHQRVKLTDLVKTECTTHRKKRGSSSKPKLYNKATARA